MFGAGSQSSALGFGGYSPPGYHALTEDWNGASWVEVADMSTGRSGGGSAGVSDSTTALAFGGATPSVTAGTEEWSGSSVSTKTIDTD